MAVAYQRVGHKVYRVLVDNQYCGQVAYVWWASRTGWVCNHAPTSWVSRQAYPTRRAATEALFDYVGRLP
jgi:hypothetical protein